MTSQLITEYAVVAVAALLLIVLGIAIARRARSRAFERRYGAEYDRTLNIAGSRSQAEGELRRREARVREMHVTDLPNSQKFRYVAQWRSVQGGFVDEPRSAVERADALIANVMRDRGYTSDSFDQRIEDLSPNHADVLDRYRNAHAIAVRARKDGTSTEELRRAIIDYRMTFDELVGQPRQKEPV